MIRKKAEQSNTSHIGIFADKSAKYNLGILETLYKLQAATAWQIAKTLSATPEMSKEVLDYRARNLYSIIQRKKGRLADLKSKGYIQQQEGLWSLTQKGRFALEIKCPELLEEPEKEVKLIFDPNKQKFTISQPFGIPLTPLRAVNDVLKIVDQLGYSPGVLNNVILSEVKTLLTEGIDLDRISEDTLVALLFGSSRFADTLDNLIKFLETKEKAKLT